MNTSGMTLNINLPPSVWKTFRGIKAATMVTLGVSMLATSVAAATKPVSHFVFVENGNLTSAADIIRRPDIDGVQMIYNWKQLEVSKGNYSFSDIDSDLKLLKTIDPTKKFFVQVQDRFDAPGNQTKRVPKYLLEEPEYEGGLFMQVSSDTHQPDGWQTKHWVPAVRGRFQYLLSNMSHHLDDKIFGLNLPETAFDYDGELETSLCDAYFEGEMENVRHASAVFKTSMVIQYINFWPCETLDHHPYMERAFAMAASEKTFGLGGPDVKPWNYFQISNSYQYFHKSLGQLSHVAMAVQSPDLKWQNPKTNKTSTVDDFKSFSRDYLGSDIMFWTSEIFNATYPPPL